MKKILLIACCLFMLTACGSTPSPTFTKNLNDLRNVAEPVGKLKELDKMTIANMKELLTDDQEGISAPQIGIKKRLMIVKNNGETVVMIDPMIIESRDEQTRIETSPNVPGLHAVVKRAKSLKVEYYDEKNVRQRVTAEGSYAGAIQQQFDYLQGNLFFDNARGIFFDEK